MWLALNRRIRLHQIFLFRLGQKRAGLSIHIWTKWQVKFDSIRISWEVEFAVAQVGRIPITLVGCPLRPTIYSNRICSPFSNILFYLYNVSSHIMEKYVDFLTSCCSLNLKNQLMMKSFISDSVKADAEQRTRQNERCRIKEKYSLPTPKRKARLKM